MVAGNLQPKLVRASGKDKIFKRGAFEPPAKSALAVGQNGSATRNATGQGLRRDQEVQVGFRDLVDQAEPKQCRRVPLRDLELDVIAGELRGRLASFWREG